MSIQEAVGALAGLLATKLIANFQAFFFSSRGRHTMSLRDWSSDVCSSDLRNGSAAETGIVGLPAFVVERASRGPNVAPPRLKASATRLAEAKRRQDRKSVV